MAERLAWPWLAASPASGSEKDRLDGAFALRIDPGQLELAAQRCRPSSLEILIGSGRRIREISQETHWVPRTWQGDRRCAGVQFERATSPESSLVFLWGRDVTQV